MQPRQVCGAAFNSSGGEGSSEVCCGAGTAFAWVVGQAQLCAQADWTCVWSVEGVLWICSRRLMCLGTKFCRVFLSSRVLYFGIGIQVFQRRRVKLLITWRTSLWPHLWWFILPHLCISHSRFAFALHGVWLPSSAGWWRSTRPGRKQRPGAGHSCVECRISSSEAARYPHESCLHILGRDE